MPQLRRDERLFVASIFFWYIAAFVGPILLASGLPHHIARASGFRLSAGGVAARAQWIAFGRYLHEHESLEDVGPAGRSDPADLLSEYTVEL